MTLRDYILKQVNGKLKIANLFSNLFGAVCPHCQHKFEGYGILDEETTHCIGCKKDVNYAHKLHLKTLLLTKNKQPIQCFIDNTFIDQLIPQLRNIKYEEYMQQKFHVVFMLRGLCIEGTFTLTQANVIMHINLL